MAMRLYPLACISSRKPIEDDEIGGYRVPAGTTTTLLSPYVTHRNPVLYWEGPEAFDSKRFKEGSQRPPRVRLPALQRGLRKCIGDRFALTEGGVLVLATLVKDIICALSRTVCSS